MNTRLAFLLAALLVLLGRCPLASAQGTAFTYQGRLTDNGAPVNATYDLRFKLYADASSGTVIAGPLDVDDVGVTNGLFTLTLDFGTNGFVFNGGDRWLEIAVRPGPSIGTAAYTIVAPLQKITATPYAIRAAHFSGPVAASQITGTLASSGLGGTYGNVVLFSNAANVFNGTFTGNGDALSNLNAAKLAGLSASNFWKLDGNAGTTPGANFLGTADNQPLEFKVNGTRALRLEPTAASGAVNVIAGSPQNSVGPNIAGATIGGGGGTYLGDILPTQVTGAYGTVSGGAGNLSRGPFATVGGGILNNSGGAAATVGGGRENTASSDSDTVGGGENNHASGSSSTVSGGGRNTSDGQYATVPGGLFNAASGRYSFAAGINAKANHEGSFVWANRLSPAPSFAAERFHINTYNGLSVDYNAPRADGGGTKWILIGATSGGQAIATSTGAWLSDGGVWNNNSDRNRKDAFAEVNSREVLDKLVALPIHTWHYTNETAEIRHLGPMAQDFRATFGLGSGDKSIAPVDADGVALAAIQGLNQKLNEKTTEIQELNARLERLENLMNQAFGAAREER